MKKTTIGLPINTTLGELFGEMRVRHETLRVWSDGDTGEQRADVEHIVLPSLATDIPCRLVVAERDELRVAQVIVTGPLDELDLRDEDRLQPSTIHHLRGRQSLAPSAAPGFRQVREWALLDLSSPRNFLNSCCRAAGVKPFRVRAA